MINTLKTSGHTAYGLKEYVIDSESDLQNLPIDIPMGSVAIIIATGKVYMLNGSGEWVLI